MYSQSFVSDMNSLGIKQDIVGNRAHAFAEAVLSIARKLEAPSVFQHLMDYEIGLRSNFSSAVADTWLRRYRDTLRRECLLRVRALDNEDGLWDTDAADEYLFLGEFIPEGDVFFGTSDTEALDDFRWVLSY